ncbi:MAG: discoidin domain-containing protein [Phycisphaerales bacterium]|nr:discoidin domain-containing protein [Phycisphaerales bacterium]
MKITFAVAAALAFLPLTAAAQICNLKLVTDASPDYSDMSSMVYSITSRWDTPAEKCWALFYWNHIARRQTSPMHLRGVDLTDPIMQYNDYGFTMCSTVSGINTATWDFMGMPVRYWEIGNHTVCEVQYDNRWHMYDNSLSAIYTLCDGKTIAGVEDIGAEGACELSNGVKELGHIAKYHCLSGTSPNGYLTGADCDRTLDSEARSFNPRNIKYQYFYKCDEYGHRYILNLHDDETYTRYYHRLDENGPNTVGKNSNFKNDPAYYVPIVRENRPPFDPESSNPRYRIRGNGIREWKPSLTKDSLPTVVYAMTNIKARDNGSGVTPAEADKPAEIIFKVEGANVITSMNIDTSVADGFLPEKGNVSNVTFEISCDDGRSWKPISMTKRTYKSGLYDSLSFNLLDEVNGSYNVLVKAKLQPNSSLMSIKFTTITQVNAKTLPKLNIGKNTIYLGAGDQTESIVFTPDLRKGQFEKYAAKIENLTSVASADSGRYAELYIDDAAVPKGWVDFKVDAPTDITSFTYGARMCIRAPKSSVEFHHSFDDGKTWIQDAHYNTTEAPWDLTRYHTINDIPPNTRSILFRYRLDSYEGTPALCGLYSVRMELHHKIAEPIQNATIRAATVRERPIALPNGSLPNGRGSDGPLEVTFNWQERQKDYSAIARSHTQLIDKLPFTYTINVAGEDHPVMESVTITPKGTRPDVKYGYSDDNENKTAKKWTGTWSTYGTNLALHKPYTTSAPSLTNWGAGDPDGKKLTDGRVGSSYSGGSSYKEGLLWPPNANPEIIVDLGSPQKCAAFRIHTHGYPACDAIKGQNKDQVELLTSLDGKQYTSVGNFNFNLRWKDIPVNYMWTDEETFNAHNFLLAPPSDKAPIEARYVKYKITSPRMIDVTEVQVLDGFELKPFDLKIALPK